MSVGMFIHPHSTLPYNKLLADSLKQEVNLKLLEVLSKKWVSEDSSALDIVHFQWTIGFFDASKKLQQWKQVLAFIYFLFLLRKKGCKIVWTVHNIHPHDRPLFPYYLGNMFLAHLADAIIVHAESASKEVKQWYGLSKKIVVIPYTTYQGYSKIYTPNYSKVKARRELRLPENKFIYLFFGYIRKYKGVDIIIKAFQKKRPKNSILLIAGGYWSNKERKEIEKLVGNDPDIILHTEEIIGKSVQQHMAAADVVVLPYRKITTSGVLVLALTFGKPIIAVKKGMLPEWVSEKNGILVEREQDLETALHEIQKKDLKAMEAASYKLSQEYPWSRIAQLYRGVYKKVLRRE